jgi:hypothetical protein
MNPSPSAVAAIRAQVSDWSLSNEQIAEALNRLDVPNPTPPPMVPKPITVAALMGSLSVPSRQNVKALPGLPRVLEQIEAQDRTAVHLWVQLLGSTGDITQDEVTTCVAELERTVVDPAHAEVLPWSVLHLGREADADDIQQARP